MCHYEVVAKDALPEVVSTYPSAFVCNTNDGDQPREYWVAMYVDRSVTTSTVRTKAATRRVSNFMNERCSQWSPNDKILQSHISTVCGQYCVDFVMFRRRNISMHAFARLFTTDLIVNDCRVFDWLGALNKTNDEKHLCLLVMLTTSTTAIDSHFMPRSQTYTRQYWVKKTVHTVRLIKEII